MNLNMEKGTFIEDDTSVVVVYISHCLLPTYIHVCNTTIYVHIYMEMCVCVVCGVVCVYVCLCNVYFYIATVKTVQIQSPSKFKHILLRRKG